MINSTMQSKVPSQQYVDTGMLLTDGPRKCNILDVKSDIAEENSRPSSKRYTILVWFSSHTQT